MTPSERRQAILTLIRGKLALAKGDRALKALTSPGVSVNTVSRVLRGYDHHVTTLAEIAENVDCELVIEFKPRPHNV